MSAAEDVRRYETGETGNPAVPFEQGWFSRIRARKVLGDNVTKGPFVRIWGAIKTVASPMNQDKITAIADAVGWRRTNPNTVGGVVPAVTDVGDKFLIMWEYFLLDADPAKLANAVTNAKAFVKWPPNYPGAADFEQGT